MFRGFQGIMNILCTFHVFVSCVCYKKGYLDLVLSYPYKISLEMKSLVSEEYMLSVQTKLKTFVFVLQSFLDIPRISNCNSWDDVHRLHSFCFHLYRCSYLSIFPASFGSLAITKAVFPIFPLNSGSNNKLLETVGWLILTAYQTLRRLFKPSR